MREWAPAQFAIVGRVMTPFGSTDDWREVSGFVSDIWGIHNAGCDRTPFWTVTHLPSGRAMSPPMDYGKREHAERLVDAIAGMTDWDRVQWKRDIPPVVRRKVKALRVSEQITA
jgi:hypothetical protein